MRVATFGVLCCTRQQAAATGEDGAVALHLSTDARQQIDGEGATIRSRNEQTVVPDCPCPPSLSREDGVHVPVAHEERAPVPVFPAG